MDSIVVRIHPEVDSRTKFSGYLGVIWCYNISRMVAWKGLLWIIEEVASGLNH